MTTVKVFISYARKDIQKAKQLCRDLRKNGVDPWIDDEKILVGQNWKREISKAIRENDFFLALFSSNSVSRKGYVQKEVRFALDQLDEYPEDEIFVLPVRLDDCSPSFERLRDIHYADLFPDSTTYEKGLNAILQKLKLGEETLTPDGDDDTVESVAGKAEKKRDDRFILYHKGTVFDTKTNLMWVGRDNGKDIDWPDGKAYCEKYRGGGYEDWCLPSIDELRSLYDGDMPKYVTDCGWEVL